MKATQACAAEICLILATAVSFAQKKFFDCNGVSIRKLMAALRRSEKAVHGSNFRELVQLGA